MRHSPRRWLAPLLLGLSAALPAASADETHPALGGGPPQAAQPAAPDAGEKTEKPTPPLSIFAAAAAAIVVLCLLCVPSRKAESSTSK